MRAHLFTQALRYTDAMNDYILFMHDDVVDAAIATDATRWGQYMSALRASGQFDGGSAIGKGMVFKKDCAGTAAAQKFLIGNPNYEAGGTVEIRELPRT